jgi:hypothetical protein
MAWVTDPTNELMLHFADLSGVRSTSQYWVLSTEVDPLSGAPIALADAAQAITADVLESIEILRHAHQSSGVVPTDGPYARAADKANLIFGAADGSVVKMQVPSPNEGIFDAGAFNVDTTDAAVIAFNAYVLANLKSEDGAAITVFSKGYRRRPPRRKHQ